MTTCVPDTADEVQRWAWLHHASTPPAGHDGAALLCKRGRPRALPRHLRHLGHQCGRSHLLRLRQEDTAVRMLLPACLTCQRPHYWDCTLAALIGEPAQRSTAHTCRAMTPTCFAGTWRRQRAAMRW